MWGGGGGEDHCVLNICLTVFICLSHMPVCVCVCLRVPGMNIFYFHLLQDYCIDGKLYLGFVSVCFKTVSVTLICFTGFISHSSYLFCLNVFCFVSVCSMCLICFIVFYLFCFSVFILSVCSVSVSFVSFVSVCSVICFVSVFSVLFVSVNSICRVSVCCPMFCLRGM